VAANVSIARPVRTVSVLNSSGKLPKGNHARIEKKRLQATTMIVAFCSVSKSLLAVSDWVALMF
jgi:hypothetical protein